VADLAPSPSRLEVFPTLWEGLSLLPRAIGHVLPMVPLILVYCLSSLVALIVYQDLRARWAPTQAQPGEGVPA
jgi:hypothetical protein